MSCIPMVQTGGFNGRFLIVICWFLPPAMIFQDDITFFSRKSWIKHLLFATGILGWGENKSKVCKKICPRFVSTQSRHELHEIFKDMGRRLFFASDFGPPQKGLLFLLCGLHFVEKSGDVSSKSVKIEVTKFSRSGLFVGLVGLFLLINNDLEFSVCNLEPKQGA